MGATKKAKITFTCSHELKNFLEAWSESESRTLSNLVEKIVEEAVADKQLPPPPKKFQPTQNGIAARKATKHKEDK